MDEEWNFDDIKPYGDHEVEGVIQRLMKEPVLFQVMKWVFPYFDNDDIKEMLSEIHSIDDFQQNISGPVFKLIAQKTTNGLSFNNMDNLEKDKAYLFLSNHRDIILDSALLNVSLMEKGYETTQIAIGDNLLRNPVIYDLVRINKNFIVNRDLHPKEMILVSRKLSNYIRKTITKDKTSIWIAHKEGRAKDGDDRTATGLIKMLSLSNPEDFEEGIEELNIVPMVVSYEYDPTDVFKANELLSKLHGGSYDKAPDEDFRSMIQGLTGHKGRVNITVGDSVNTELTKLKDIDNKNEKIRELTNSIDEKMHSLYKLWPTNYIAYDWLNGEREYSKEYTPIQRVAFKNYIRGRILNLLVNRKKLGHQREGLIRDARKILLEMYANPVANLKALNEAKTDIIL